MANWYYYEGSDKKGPVDSTVLKSLAQHGIVREDTPIETEAGQISIAGKIKGLTFKQPVPPVAPPPVQSAPSPFTQPAVPLPVTVNVVSGRSHAGDGDEQILYEASPLMFRNNIMRVTMWAFLLMLGLFFLLIGSMGDAPNADVESVQSFFFLLGVCMAGLSVFSLAMMLIDCLTTKLTITNHKSILRKGILSKRTVELLHEHIRSVKMSQGIIDRLLNVGRIDISTAASGVAEISVSGMLDPEKIKRLVQQYQRR